jgi:hypothetical protein
VSTQASESNHEKSRKIKQTEKTAAVKANDTRQNKKAINERNELTTGTR